MSEVVTKGFDSASATFCWMAHYTVAFDKAYRGLGSIVQYSLFRVLDPGLSMWLRV